MKTIGPFAAGVGLAVFVCGAIAYGGGPAVDLLITPRQIEEDWLRQEMVRGAGPVNPVTHVTPEQDAAGAVDGVKDGKWGFHTARTKSPGGRSIFRKRPLLATC